MSEILMDFVHGDSNQHFRVEASPSLPPAGYDGLQSLWVRELDGPDHGDIRGIAYNYKGDIVFKVSNARNLQRHTSQHVRGVVGAAVAELVANGIISRWESHPSLSRLARKMYDRISADN